jgi:HAD superfamily hydrolase (TIGR01509 family)
LWSSKDDQDLKKKIVAGAAGYMHYRFQNLVMTTNIKVALFDLDGTIIDTEPYHYQCWNNILLEQGFDMSYEHYLANYAGVSIDSNCQRLVDKFNLTVSAEVLKGKKERMMIEILLHYELVPMTFVKEMIRFLTAQHIALGLVTSSSTEETDIILKGLHLDEVFQYVVTRDDVVNKKPDPEPYLLAKSLFNLPVEDFIVLEDSMAGIRSAKATGMTCYAVRNNVLPGSIYHEEAAGVFKDLVELKNKLFPATQYTQH